MSAGERKARDLKILEFPNARDWSPAEEDWKLPKDWEGTVLEAMADRLSEVSLLSSCLWISASDAAPALISAISI